MKKHDRLIELVYNRLNALKAPHYSLIDHNIVFGHSCQDYGEIDLYCIHESKSNRLNHKVDLLFFEMKSNDTKKARKKAYKQLANIKDRFVPGKYSRAFYFYVYGTDDGYKIERVKL